MRKTIFRFLIILFLCGLSSSGESVVDRIVAIVNQEIITLSEVEKIAIPHPKGIETGDRLERRGRVQTIFRKVLEQLIEEKLIDQEVKKIGIKITSKELDGALEEIKQRNAATQEDLENALARDGLTLEVYKKQLEKNLQRIKFMQMNIKVESKVGEKELINFYQKNTDRYRSGESYRPAHILLAIPAKATEEEILEIRKKGQKILEKIKRGEDFGEMALLYSDDLSGKDRGDLGYIKKGELLPAFEREALRLRAGEISGMIRTNFGFHIIKILDRKEGVPLPFEEVRMKVLEDYSQLETDKAIKQLMSTLKEKAVIEIKL